MKIKIFSYQKKDIIRLRQLIYQEHQDTYVHPRMTNLLNKTFMTATAKKKVNEKVFGHKNKEARDRELLRKFRRNLRYRLRYRTG
jgi:hypothetical protein